MRFVSDVDFLFVRSTCLNVINAIENPANPAE
jgi:hypothetical protein